MRLGSEWLGRFLDVTIDRPLGSAHPDWPDLVYSVNYGHVPGTAADDGEPIDVYVLDETQPLRSASVYIVAIIHRHDDIEDKLVGRSSPLHPAPREVMQAVAFAERWFDVTIETLTGQARYDKASVKS